MRKATKTVAMWLGIAAGLAGLEHGYFEILQGNTRPPSLAFPSMGPPCDPAVAWSACEPAMSILPSFLLTGVLALLRPLAPPRLQSLPLIQHLQLSWPAVPGATGYRVYWHTANPYFAPAAPWQTTAATSVVDPDALGQPGSMTFYAAQSFNGFAQSGYSARVGEFEFGLVK